MRVIAALILTLAGTAHANVLASRPNDAGGEIVITDKKGPCSVGRVAWTWAPEMEPGRGCWAFVDGKVVVVWEAIGEARSYPTDGWSFRGKGSNV